MQQVLITGGAGFIGSHLIDHLIQDENNIITCLDNFDDFYDPAIKRNNISKHLQKDNFTLVEEDIRNVDALRAKLNKKYDVIVHLAAKSGVRNSIKNPVKYQETNLAGTQNLLELARECGIRQFVFASSNSVYGKNPNVPWCENDCVLQPISPYASSKVAAELLGHVYSHLYGIRFIAFRLFTVYGPRQRPDLVIHKFFKSIIKGDPIDLYGNGSTQRDYTYISDVVQGILSAMNYNKNQYEIINLGSNQPVTLKELLQRIESISNKKSIINYMSEQPGDVSWTFADISKAKTLLMYKSTIDIQKGLEKFYEWITTS